MMDQIDRNSTIPLYEQIKQIIRSQILSGEYSFGSRLPTEEELCEQFDVSTITVKRALSELVRAGLIQRRRGSGTIVTRKPVDDNFNITAGFSEVARTHGRETSSKILGIELVEANENLLTTFQLPANSNSHFISFRRLLNVDDVPSAVLTAFVPEEIGEKMRKYDLENRSFYQLYEEITGRKVVRNENKLAPVSVSPEIAKLLDVSPGSAHMLIRGVSYLEGGLPTEMSVGIFSGDVFEWKADTYQVRNADQERSLDPVYGDFLDKIK
ncbi:MAG: GntR family transcriptional regulator [Chloroflexi bacterium]|nr:MAG: GntR family transcriptional regulator [Chloroflexota bacterium]MBL1192780.1 GntR family transcriptional regulator [Chloroflexota bacterium]NOH10074.1 GntR family transcriptional regulator [Chloroflexota bacterium]